MREKLIYMFERLDSYTDVLTQVLEAVHLGGALSSRTELRAPWALHFGSSRRRAGFHVVTAGQCWATLDGTGQQIAIGAGDVILFPHGTGHTLGDAPETPPVDVGDLPDEQVPGPLASGTGDATTVICGAYSFAADGANPLLSGLPQMLHVPAEHTRGGPVEAAVRLLTAEAGGTSSGTSLVVDRLVDLLFVYALRSWLDHQDAATSHSWFGALQDPVVGPAVRAIHDDPGHDWTVTALAQRSGVSRAAFARRFHQAVGEPPLNYVTRWRMNLAADLLDRGERIGGIAHQVGYDNEFAFAKAFKRVRGIAPGQYRRREMLG